MYFVITFFIAFCCFAAIVLFIDIFSKVIKGLLSIGGILSAAVAVSKAYDKIATLTKWYKTDYNLLPDLYYIVGILTIIYIIIYFYGMKHHKAFLERREKGIQTEKEKKKAEKLRLRMIKEDEEDAAYRQHEKELEEKRAKKKADRINKKLEKKAAKINAESKTKSEKE